MKRRGCHRGPGRFSATRRPQTNARLQSPRSSILTCMRTELVERYRGRWVAVNQAGDVVADAEELGELLHACDGKGYSADVAVHRVPEADAPLVVGLG